MAGSEIFKWFILPLLIFLARIIDVSLGTIRIVFISRGLKYFAPVVGFFEVIIWLLAIRVIMQNLNNFVCYIAYGAGFGMGTFIGIIIEKKLAIGRSIIRIITQNDATPLINHLRSEGYGVTSQDAQGTKGQVNVIYMVIRRHDYEKIAKIIQRFNPKAFYTMEDVSLVSEGIFPIKRRYLHSFPLVDAFRFWRKGK
ncbi:MAG: DUF2179 domain-containing protein [Candidatus Aminicenantes bacterium]|nr:DUF2179 domain-containing protein [Candidatus Aminicenantes bacterium]